MQLGVGGAATQVLHPSLYTTIWQFAKPWRINDDALVYFISCWGHAHVSLCCLGDWHIAYLLLYSPLRLEKLKEEEGEGAGEKTEPMDTTQAASDDKPASS